MCIRDSNITNVCSIFEDRRGWYSAAKSAEDRWGIPIAVNMAFIYHDSSFISRAKPDRTRVLWVIPGSRPSSAYGYAQALDGTWDDYRVASRNRGASRSDFDDSIDLEEAINTICDRVTRSVKKGNIIIILSDKKIGKNQLTIPAPMAIGAVHHRLIDDGLRCDCNLIVETASASNPHHFAVLLGYGATAIYPYLSLEILYEKIYRKNTLQKI